MLATPVAINHIASLPSFEVNFSTYNQNQTTTGSGGGIGNEIIYDFHTNQAVASIAQECGSSTSTDQKCSQVFALIFRRVVEEENNNNNNNNENSSRSTMMNLCNLILTLLVGAGQFFESVLNNSGTNSSSAGNNSITTRALIIACAANSQRIFFDSSSLSVGESSSFLIQHIRSLIARRDRPSLYKIINFLDLVFTRWSSSSSSSFFLLHDNDEGKFPLIIPKEIILKSSILTLKEIGLIFHSFSSSSSTESAANPLTRLQFSALIVSLRFVILLVDLIGHENNGNSNFPASFLDLNEKLAELSKSASLCWSVVAAQFSSSSSRLLQEAISCAVLNSSSSLKFLHLVSSCLVASLQREVSHNNNNNTRISISTLTQRWKRNVTILQICKNSNENNNENNNENENTTQQRAFEIVFSSLLEDALSLGMFTCPDELVRRICLLDDDERDFVSVVDDDVSGTVTVAVDDDDQNRNQRRRREESAESLARRDEMLALLVEMESLSRGNEQQEQQEQQSEETLIPRLCRALIPCFSI